MAAEFNKMQTMTKQSRSIIDLLGEVEDERRDNANREHKLVDILIISLCGMLSGADDWNDGIYLIVTRIKQISCFVLMWA